MPTDGLSALEPPIPPEDGKKKGLLFFMHKFLLQASKCLLEWAFSGQAP